MEILQGYIVDFRDEFCIPASSGLIAMLGLVPIFITHNEPNPRILNQTVLQLQHLVKKNKNYGRSRLINLVDVRVKSGCRGNRTRGKGEILMAATWTSTGPESLHPG